MLKSSEPKDGIHIPGKVNLGTVTAYIKLVSYFPSMALLQKASLDSFKEYNLHCLVSSVGRGLFMYANLDNCPRAEELNVIFVLR